MKAFIYQYLNLLFLVNIWEHLRFLLLRSPEKVNYAQLLHAYIAFHGTAMKRGVCCWLVTVPRAEASAPHPLCLVLLL